MGEVGSDWGALGREGALGESLSSRVERRQEMGGGHYGRGEERPLLEEEAGDGLGVGVGMDGLSASPSGGGGRGALWEEEVGREGISRGQGRPSGWEGKVDEKSGSRETSKIPRSSPHGMLAA